MSIPIVTTPARTHLAKGPTYTVGMHSAVATVCGKFLVDGGENHFGTHEGGDLAASITCKNCRRTIAPSKVLFADEGVAVVGPGQAVTAAVVPASPQIELRWGGDYWEIHVNFGDPASDPLLFVNGYEASVCV